MILKIGLYLKHMFSFKKTYLFYAIPLLYPFYVLLRPIDALDSTELFYIIYDNIFSIYTATFLLTPLYLLLIDHNSTLFDHNNIILKMKTKDNWWKVRIGLLGIDITIFTLFTNMLVYLSLAALHKLSSVHLLLLSNVLGSALKQFLGYAILGVLFIAVTILTGKKYMGFIMAYAIIALDYICLQFGIKINILSYYMFIFANDGKSWLLHFLYLISILGVICYISIYLIKKRDLLEIV